MAACAIPVIFPPVKVEGIAYVDGGLSNNLPVEPFADRKAEVVAVYVNPLPPFVPDRRSVLRTMDRAWHLNFREMVTRSAQGCGLFIEPPGLSRFGLLEVRRLDAIEAVGYAYVKTLFPAR
jgi:NTE family protein